MTNFHFRPSAEEIDELHWHVEEWNDADTKKERIVALACNLDAGIAAWEAYVRQYPDKRCCMRQGMRMVRNYVPERLKPAKQD